VPKPFWEEKSLNEMNNEEWESLCDGCGRCCLHKLENDADNLIYYTEVACRLLDRQACRCMNYAERSREVADCIQLSADTLPELNWLPSTCAYRLLAEGRALPEWHPLITGDPESVHQAGISVRGRCVEESEVEDLEDHIVMWLE
jgi:uncharacterized cysteine cluster protein YcgN (CxxCxxCC family)